MYNDKLRQALNSISHAIPKRASIPVIDGVYFGKCIAATNLEQYASVEGFDYPGVVLPAKVIDIVNSLNGDVDLAFDDNQNCTIKSGGSKFRLNGFLAEDYPEIPKLRDGSTVSGRELKHAFQSVVFAASTEESRRAFNGVLVDGGKVVASDTYRLAIHDIPLQGRCLIPARFLSNLKQLPDGDIRVSISDDIISFSVGDLTLSSRLLNEKYPDITAVVPKEHKLQITANRDDLMGAITRAALLAEGKHKAINLSLQDSLTVSINSQSGSLTEQVDCQMSGEPVELLLNAQYLADVLKISPDEVTLHFHGEGGAVVAKWDEYLYLMLPIKKAEGVN